jgi:hypothetical protein
VHHAALVGLVAARDVRGSGVSVDQRGFHLDRGVAVETVPVDDVSDLEAGAPDLADSLQLFRLNVRPGSQLVGGVIDTRLPLPRPT